MGKLLEIARRNAAIDKAIDDAQKADEMTPEQALELRTQAKCSINSEIDAFLDAGGFEAVDYGQVPGAGTDNSDPKNS